MILENNFDLPALLRTARQSAGLTQAAAAVAIGQGGRAYICQIETGRVEIKAGVFLKLAKLYRMDLNEIIK